MTKMLMTIEAGLKQKLSDLLDKLADLLVNFEDYTLFNKISLSECFFFVFASLRAVWFLIFGAESQHFSYYFSDTVWKIVFAAITLAHLGGFLFRIIRLRVIALYLHTAIWMFLTFLAVFSRTTAPAVPTFVPLFIFSLFLIVRISREKPVSDEL